MANYSNLKAAINAVIKQNGQGEITGEVMNQVLTAMVNSLGSNYLFAGVATPSTNPGTPDQNVFYMATQAGTYTNFSAIVLQAGISILLWNGSWSSETFFEIDSVPTSGSGNFISSGAVFDKFKLDGGAYDVSAHNSNQTFSSLSALLSDANLSTLIPTNIRSGGMSIKFVQSSDNKYVKYRYIGTAVTGNPNPFVDTTNWLTDEEETIVGKCNEDFAISDEESNAVLIINKGELKTKNFNSLETVKIANTYSDLIFTDENDNILVKFSKGQVETKYFNSKDFTKPFTGKKLVCIGDSITYGQGLVNRTTEVYHAQLAAKTGCINVNRGVSGTGLCTNMTNGTSNDRFITRATNATLSDADIIIVFGGTNDFTYDSKAIGSYYNEISITPNDRIGNKEKTIPTDTDTFSGALHELLLHIRELSDAPIIFITPLHRSNYAAGRPNSWQVNVNGNYLSDYVAAIKNICADYSVPVLDLYSCYNLDFNDVSMRQQFSVDGIHPNKEGHSIICELLYKFIVNNINI